MTAHGLDVMASRCSGCTHAIIERCRDLYPRWRVTSSEPPTTRHLLAEMYRLFPGIFDYVTNPGDWTPPGTPTAPIVHEKVSNVAFGFDVWFACAFASSRMTSLTCVSL